MKAIQRILTLVLLMGTTVTLAAQQINDNNTPLHLMKPAYKLGYGVSTAESVKQTMDRVLRYIDAETPRKSPAGRISLPTPN